MTILNYDARNVNLWNKIGPRAAYGSILNELAKADSTILAISADLGNSSGLDRFKSEHPDRFIQIGIAEQNMIGVASGLANEGFIPFVSSFAPFITMRAAEQIRMNLGYMEHNVKLIGIGSGLSMGFLGNSHYGLEDIAIIKAIPNIKIFSPCDGFSIARTLENTLINNSPTYIRLTGLPSLRAIYDVGADFIEGKANQLRTGDDLVVVSNGAILSIAVSAADALVSKNIYCSVFDFHTIRPFDLDTCIKLLEEYSKILVVEEHFSTGGLTSEFLSTAVSHGLKSEIYSITIPEEYGLTGDYKFALESRGISQPIIEEKIQEILANKAK